MEHFARRRANVSDVLAPDSAYITSDPVAVRYLTGFTGSSGTVLVDATATTLVTDGRYRDQASEECPNVTLVIDRAGLRTAARCAMERGLSTVVVSASVPYAQIEFLKAAMGEVTVVEEDPVAVLRRIKDGSELVALRKACAITSESLMAIGHGIRVGDREIDIARRLEAEFARRGAEDRAFPTIVAAGANSAIPHHRPTDTPVQEGDLLVIDCGARVDGYHADMTRTFVVGLEPAAWQSAIFAAVSDAASAGRDSVSDGASCAAIDGVARSVIDAAGFGENFTHGTGHAVGLVIHEVPMINSESTDTLSAGMAVTVEPGIYLPSRGGVRIEDTLEVTHGGADVLTEAPRALARVG